MTGLDKMKSQILNEAQTDAKSKLAQADRDAENILNQAKTEREKLAASLSGKAEAEAVRYRERVKSSIDLERRTQILSAKQEVIKEVLDKTYDRLKTMETGAYFDMLLKLLDQYVLPEKGEMYMSSEDLLRVPETFEAAVQKAAEKKGGSLVLMKEGKKIENGFILVYNGIEENCTLKAIFDAKKDELADKINEFLFVQA